MVSVINETYGEHNGRQVVVRSLAYRFYFSDLDYLELTPEDVAWLKAQNIIVEVTE